MGLTKVKKWALGLAIIIVASLGLFIATFDGDPETKPDVKHTIEEVHRGVDVIKGVDELKDEVNKTEKIVDDLKDDLK